MAAGGKSVHQAVWSASPIVSWSFHSLAHSDLLLSLLVPMIKSGASNRRLKAAYLDWLNDVPYPDPPEHRLPKPDDIRSLDMNP
jgi:hypothetical protein